MLAAMKSKSKRKIQSGERFGRLVTLEYSIKRLPSGATKGMWKCECDCGNVKIIQASNMANGHTQSCGCFHSERLLEATKIHGMSHATPNGPPTTEYRIWQGMRARCLRKTTPCYERYGGRGIGICKRWDKFENFYADMGPRPPGTTIDRRENHLDYSPKNCRWATAREQTRNKRSNINITIGNETMCATDWAHRMGIKPAIIFARIGQLEWDHKKAVMHPVKTQRR